MLLSPRPGAFCARMSSAGLKPRRSGRSRRAPSPRRAGRGSGRGGLSAGCGLQRSDSLRGPLASRFAPRPLPARGERCNSDPVLAMRLRIRALLHALRKPFVPPLKEGRRSAERRTTGSAPPQQEKPASVCGEHHRFFPAKRGIKTAAPSPFGAPPRSCAEGLTLRLGSGPRFLESPDPNGRTLSGASAASTWQSGHAPDGRCPKPPGSRLQARSGNRTRPIDQLSPVDVPSMGDYLPLD